MEFLWLGSFCLVASGAVVMIAGVLRRGGSFLTRLEDRRVSPPWWGYQTMAAGTVLSLALWRLGETPWARLTSPDRPVVMAAVLWTSVALTLSVVTVARRGGRTGLVPRPRSSLREWPRFYGPFLLFGGAIAARLAWHLAGV
jgi:hypothetical protein